MSTPHPSGLPPWLVQKIKDSTNLGVDQAKIDKILEPMYTKDEEPPSRGEKSKQKEGGGSKERHEKKTKVRAERVQPATIKNKPKTHLPPVASSSTGKLAVDTNMTNSAPQISRSQSAEIGLPSPMDSPESFDTVFIPETRAEAKFSSFDEPLWYKNINVHGSTFKMWLKSRNVQSEKSLQRMKECIGRCEQAGSRKELAKILDELRNEIHKAEITLEVDGNLLRKNFMLHPTGIVQIFTSDKVDFPWDIRADAFQLYNRWREEDFKVHLLRHIVTKRSLKRNADSIAADWSHSADYYGEGNLVLGQWWPTQLCTVRDSAHGAAQGGIYGRTGKGAFSIVLAAGGYDDQDNGEDIWYSGTVSNDLAKTMARSNSTTQVGTEHVFGATSNTRRLIESCEMIKNPVRVIRSHNLPKSNLYRPSVGFRYDGLYEVVAYELTDKAKGAYRFNLKRCAGQNPIRYKDNAARRPTSFEIAEYEKLKLDG